MTDLEKAIFTEVDDVLQNNVESEIVCNMNEVEYTKFVKHIVELVIEDDYIWQQFNDGMYDIINSEIATLKNEEQ